MDRDLEAILMRIFQHPDDAWFQALPEDNYDPCPCGCGKKLRFVEKGGEAEIKKHYDEFVRKFMERQNELSKIQDGASLEGLADGAKG